MKRHSARRTLVLVLGLLLAVLMLASDVEARKKNKKKDKKTKPAPVTATPQESASDLVAPSAAAREADRYLNAFDTEAARRALDAASEEDAWTVTARGRILEQKRDYEAAIAELNRAADLDTRNPVPLLFLGDSYSYSNKRSSADAAYSKAEARARDLLEAKANDPDALYFLGVAQQRQRGFEEAAATLERARSLRPGDSTILYQLGVTRFYQDQFQAAFDRLSEALDKNSGIAYAYYYRGLAAAKLERKDLLFNDLDRFVKMAPDAPEAATAKQILDSFS